jgi:hypothetical protein
MRLLHSESQRRTGASFFAWQLEALRFASRRVGIQELKGGPAA